MEKRQIYKLVKVVTVLSICTLASCSKLSGGEFDEPNGKNVYGDATPSSFEGPVTLAFSLSQKGESEENATKTTLDPDGYSVNWQDSDRISLWAKNQSEEWSFANHVFNMYGFAGKRAVFTSLFESAMPQGQYTYYGCSPVPASVSGTQAVFEIPSRQNGSAGNWDVMVMDPVSGPALRSAAEEMSEFSFTASAMHHMMHIMNFYLPVGSEGLNGEPVSRIVATFPKNVTGSASVDITDPSVPVALGNASPVLELQPLEALVPSVEGTRKYVSAVIVPAEFGDDDKMSVSLYSQNWMGRVDDIPLRGRTFASGHATPVKLKVAEVMPYYNVLFTFGENNIGEDVFRITLSTSDNSLVFGKGGSTTYDYQPGGYIPVGTNFRLEYFDDQDSFDAYAGKTLTVTYESDHVITSQNILLPSVGTSRSRTVSLRAPYLLEEDFSTFPDFSKEDKYTGGSNAGSYSTSVMPYGWTGGRLGCQSGVIRLAARRETSARYGSRLDSAPLPTIKSPVNVEVAFNYGHNNAFGGVTTILDTGDYGETVYVGYVTSTETYKSSKDTGYYDFSFTCEAKDGDWVTPRENSVVIKNMPAGTTNRISWRTMVIDHAGLTNTTCWLYLDNVKVKIKK